MLRSKFDLTIIRVGESADPARSQNGEANIGNWCVLEAAPSSRLAIGKALETAMTEDIRLIPRLLGRSGPVVCIGFENTGQHEAIVTNISLLCSARSESLSQAMLFGVPLAILGEQRSIKVGLSTFEVAIQGYSLADPMNPLARRNFDNVFGMIKTRMPRIIKKSSDKKEGQGFSDAALGFTKELIALHYKDFNEGVERLAEFDAHLIHQFSVNWLVRGGEVVSKHFRLGSKSVAWWLSNHIIGTEQSLI